jgi:hypothetical protein
METDAFFQTAGTLLPNSTFQTLALTSPELNDTFGPTALVAMTMPPNVGSQQLQLTQLPIHLGLSSILYDHINKVDTNRIVESLQFSLHIFSER